MATTDANEPNDEPAAVGTDAVTDKAFGVWRIIALMEDNATPALREILESADGLATRAIVRAVAQRHPDFAAFEALRMPASARIH